MNIKSEIQHIERSTAEIRRIRDELVNEMGAGMKRDLGNNETICLGVFKNEAGYTALTFSKSKTFKTHKGACKWLALHGFNADGTRK